MESHAGYFGIKLIIIIMYVLKYINGETHYSDYSVQILHFFSFVKVDRLFLQFLHTSRGVIFYVLPQSSRSH